MDNAQKWRRLALILGMILLSMGSLGTRGEAGELGHYAPSLFNVRDFVMPPKGLCVAL
jgi:hypothetical protein